MYINLFVCRPVEDYFRNVVLNKIIIHVADIIYNISAVVVNQITTLFKYSLLIFIHSAVD